MRVYTISEIFQPNESICITKNDALPYDPPHIHEFLELTYICAGKGMQHVDGRVYPVEKGDLIFISQNQTHAFTSSTDMCYINYMLKPEFMSMSIADTENIFDIFSLSIFDELRGYFSQNTSLVSFRGMEMLEIEALSGYILQEFQDKKNGYKTIINSYMRVLFSRLIRKLQTPKYQEVMQYVKTFAPEILQYIDEHCFEKISLTELSQRCFYHPAYFSKMFKQCFGKSLTVYIQEKRLKTAMSALAQTTKSIDEISEMVGYADKSYFYKIFKNFTGTSPQKFRTQIKINQ